jgi:hypothetical protein
MVDFEIVREPGNLDATEEKLKQKDATRMHKVLCLALPVWIVM